MKKLEEILNEKNENNEEIIRLNLENIKKYLYKPLLIYDKFETTIKPMLLEKLSTNEKCVLMNKDINCMKSTWVDVESFHRHYVIIDTIDQ